MDRRIFIAPLLALGLACGSGGTAAQTAQALDALSRSTTQPASGMDLARRQIAEGQLTLAMATLERVILAHPDADEARLLHAGLLCRLDDLPGSRVEFDRLRGRDFPPDLWREATEPCQAQRAGD